MAIASKNRLGEIIKYEWRGENKTGTTKGHVKYWENLEEEIGLKLPESDACKIFYPDKGYIINYNSYRCTTNKYLGPSEVNVYTDGSKTESGVGAGFAIYQGGKLLREGCDTVNKEGTVFQAELVAIDLASQALVEMSKEKGYKFIKMFSDSMSSLQALDSAKITSKTVLKTKRSLNRLASVVKSVRVNWIKAHVGHEGNERADHLAKEASTMIHLSEVPRAATINKQLIKQKFYDLWTKSWEIEPTCRQTKQFFPKPDPLVSKKIINLHEASYHYC